MHVTGPAALLPSQVQVEKGMKYFAAFFYAITRYILHVDVRDLAGFVKFAVQGANYRDRLSVRHTVCSRHPDRDSMSSTTEVTVKM